MKEKRGGRCDVVGVKEHLDDASLQQFVNSKTQRPVTFRYRQVPYEGKEIGLVEIPIQGRPIYLLRDFGRLKGETVYIRRGSSTTTAKLEEVAQMGAPLAIVLEPQFELEWADLTYRKGLSETCTVESLLLDPPLSVDAVKKLRRPAGFYTPMENRQYEVELVDYVQATNFFTPVGLRIRNVGEIVGRRVRFVGSIPNTTGVCLVDWSKREGKPSRDRFSTLDYDYTSILNKDPSPDVRNLETMSELTIEFGDVRPGDDVWTACPVLVGVVANGTSRLEGELRGDNIARPMSCSLTIAHTGRQRPMETKDLEPHIDKGD